MAGVLLFFMVGIMMVSMAMRAMNGDKKRGRCKATLMGQLSSDNSITEKSVDDALALLIQQLKATPNPGAQWPTEKDEPYMHLLTSQLVAKYMTEEDQAYKGEFFRRLTFAGIEKQALKEAVFEFNRSIIQASNRQAALADIKYMDQAIFSLAAPAFPKQSQAQLAEANILTPSEVIKIFDEAEWIIVNQHEQDISADVWQEVFSISRMGGGLLLIDMSKKLMELGLSEEQSKTLMRNDQWLLGRYRWGYTHRPYPFA